MARRTRRRSTRRRTTRRQTKPTRSPLAGLFRLIVAVPILIIEIIGLALRLSLGIVAALSLGILHGASGGGRRRRSSRGGHSEYGIGKNWTYGWHHYR